MVRIGHASSDENKKLKGGKAGDQNKQEVYIRSWYNRPWNAVIRPKTKAMANKIAECMELACNNDLIGYDQNQRNTLLTEARKVGYNPSKVNVPCETDCSALVSLCCIYAGVPEAVLFKGGNSSVTSNLKARLGSTGLFELLTDKSCTATDKRLKRGDILLYEGHHVAVALDDGAEVQPTQFDGKEQFYTIVKGDTLGKIAKAFNTTPQAIKDLNPDRIKNINVIGIGWRIRVK